MASFSTMIINWRPYYIPERTKEINATTKDLKEAKTGVHITSPNLPDWPLQDPDVSC